MSIAHSWRSEWGIPPAKIDISQPDKSVLDALSGTYSQYGSIVVIRYLDNFISTLGFGYAIIEFTDGRYSEVAVVKDVKHKRYRIAPEVPSLRNSSYLPFINFNAFPRAYLQSAKSSPSPPIPRELQSPPESESSLNIIKKLNDYLLQEIFKYLPLFDICSVADVCTTFQKNAKTIFPLQFEGVTPEIDDLSRFESLARNFGTMIQSLSINCWLYADIYTETRKNAVLLILATYFSGPDCQLRSLSLTQLNIDTRWRPLLVPIFDKLRYLRLEKSRISELLCVCNELVMLDLCSDVGQFTENDSQTITALDNLERLSIWETKQWRDILFRQLDFGERMAILKIHVSETEQGYKTISEICAKFPNLQELHLAPRIHFDGWILEGQNEMVNQMMKTFKRMVDLTTLALSTVYPARSSSYPPMAGISGFLNLLAVADVPIVQLSLGCNVSYAEMNSISRFGLMEVLIINGLVLGNMPLINLISKLPQLKELRLIGEKNPLYWTKHDIKDMVEHGHQLDVLYFGDWKSDLVIYENDFDDILQTVMRRASNTKLTITIRTYRNVILAVAADKIANSSKFLVIQILPRIE